MLGLNLYILHKLSIQAHQAQQIHYALISGSAYRPLPSRNNHGARLFFIALLLLVFFSAMLFAGAGSSSAEFLLLNTGARPVALGGAYSALSNDINALGSKGNPAGLCQLEGINLGFSHNQWFEQVNFENLAYAQKINNTSALAGEFRYLHMDALTGRDASGAKIDDFTSSDLLVGLALAHQFSRSFLCGSKVKYLQENIADVTARSFALDFGALYRIPLTNLNLSLGLENLGAKMKFIAKKESLPLRWYSGFAYQLLSGFNLVGEASFLRGAKPEYCLGTEYQVYPAFSLRAGWLNPNGKSFANIPSLGLGFGTKRFGIDYAFATDGNLGTTHHISMNLQFAFSKNYAAPKNTSSFLDGTRREFSPKAPKNIETPLETLENTKGVEIKTENLETEQKITVTVWEEAIGFDSNSAEIKPESYPVLRKIAQLLNNYSGYQVKICGHTDNTGNESYNQRLSKLRAYAVMARLVKQENLPAEKLSSYGLGQHWPISDNLTSSGRAKNRRVEIIVNTALED